MRTFGTVTFGALLGLGIAFCIPGISTPSILIEVAYYLLPVIAGAAMGFFYEVIFRKWG